MIKSRLLLIFVNVRRGGILPHTIDFPEAPLRVYSIGEVCKLLGLKPHVLRYWEQEFELISPRKSDTGRRIYNNHDLQLLFRIRYLLYEKRFTIEGAKKRIWEELATGDLNLKSIITETRSLLLDSLSVLKELKNSSDKE